MSVPLILLTLGGVLLAALAVHWIGHRTLLPRASLLMLLGVASGPVGFDFLGQSREWFPLMSQAALAMVGFLLGAEFGLTNLKRRGSRALVISAVSAVMTAGCVFVGLAALGFSALAALLLAGIAPATAPAATSSVVQELNARGEFTSLLKRIVAIDDVWGLLAFSLTSALAGAWVSDEAAWDSVGHGLLEILGSILLGLSLGLPMAKLTGRLRPGEPTLLEALGSVFLCAGLALTLGLSPLLANITLGATVVNAAYHHTRPIHEIENVETPVLVLLFVLAGATLEIEQLRHVQGLALGYVGFRVLGRIVGVQIGARLTRSTRKIRRWLPQSLLAQAGVALGLAISASERFPGAADEILTTIIVSTVIFELLGPPLTKLAIVKSGDASPGSR